MPHCAIKKEDDDEPRIIFPIPNEHAYNNYGKCHTMAARQYALSLKKNQKCTITRILESQRI